MTQPKLKQLVKLLLEWESEFGPDPNRSYGDPDVSQPMYADVGALVRRQIQREIE